MSKLVVMYPKPADPAHFAKHFREVHMPLVEKMPGLQDSSYGPATGPDGGEGAFFWMFVGTWPSIEGIKAGLGSPEGQAAVADIPNYSPDHAPTLLFIDSGEG